ncbi:MAG: EscR/YscR/HrcR family type III secretion system export apparatus protein [Deltaproteobacteria bacterium RIFOXYA12_FULL_58_15]|nr:MAG: EscR/YscR/HrcR family type III secretion system export apparatus protein [Deltaproteobacteria bacterium RIFOXYA12_FULL_58_15]OGR09262.1 MAG: EscR/YscR/HrcR family type III secretion system export apparatus protein [Deltaproteobacteria bacterium RIFOXYB12_FULL_58_9]
MNRALVSRIYFGVVAFASTMAVSPLAMAQKFDMTGNESVTNRPILLVGVIAALSLVPFLLMMTTSFVKIAVVMSVVRQAIGTQQIPPTQVITGMAIILTIYVMTPVGLDIYHDVGGAIEKQQKGKAIDWDNLTADTLQTVLTTAKVPVRGFLIKHTHLRERDMFYKLAWKMRKPRDRANLTDQDFSIIVPAFVITELKEAFQIGFILFVPFLVIDMIVSNILMALGMQMLSPTTISLPFKILLFVLVDGWYLITRGLLLGYQ